MTEINVRRLNSFITYIVVWCNLIVSVYTLRKLRKFYSVCKNIRGGMVYNRRRSHLYECRFSPFPAYIQQRTDTRRRNDETNAHLYAFLPHCIFLKRTDAGTGRSTLIDVSHVYTGTMNMMEYK